MTEDELIAKADDACIFTNDLQVVPLKDALQAIKAEREACAKVCDANKDTFENGRGYGAEMCAEEIRARSNANIEPRS